MNMAEIVVVEDDPDDQYLLRKAMSDNNVSAHMTFLHDGQEALNFFTETTDTPSLLILDLNLPIITGMDVLKKLRSLNNLTALPIVVFTTSDFEVERANALEAGANAYIVKPRDYNLLKTTVADILSYCA